MHGPGSPPRGRGKVDGPPAQVGRGRITPAQAGRSPYFLYGKKDYKDHPRIGGEKAELTAAVISAMGSPPRRRGKGYREFGIDISDILDRPENVAQPMLCAAIKEAIERFEPRATYMGTTFKSSKDNPGTMLPVVEVSINA